MATSLSTTEVLVRVMLAGERGADNALARRYYPRVLAYLTRRLGDRERGSGRGT